MRQSCRRHALSNFPGLRDGLASSTLSWLMRHAASLITNSNLRCKYPRARFGPNFESLLAVGSETTPNDYKDIANLILRYPVSRIRSPGLCEHGTRYDGKTADSAHGHPRHCHEHHFLDASRCRRMHTRRSICDETIHEDTAKEAWT
jgi:hypothetical protein